MFKLSPLSRRNLIRLLPFGIIWFVCSHVFLLVEYAASGGVTQTNSAIQMDGQITLVMGLVVALVGFAFGAIELFWMHGLFERQSLSRKIIFKLMIYLLLIYLITVLTYPVAVAMELDTNLQDARVWERLRAYFSSMTHISTNVQLMVSIGLSLFYMEISEHMGPGVLANFFSGKYHTPKEEGRIFMFADMKSSTTIAEQLGHVRYFEMLKEYYYDLSDAILRSGGEIYQYVGDEIVVSWPYEGSHVDDRCLHCFKQMKADLQKRMEFYKRRYGVIPDFRAGFHLGEVTTGEIGTLKKNIIFTGDVLNATARMLELCKYFQTDIVVSDDIVQRLETPLKQRWTLQPLGTKVLRGRRQPVKLWTI